MLGEYALLFFIYSVFGWCLENVTQLIEKHKVTNRGFLVGPYCPIYGIGALLLHLLLSKYADDPIVLFLLSVIVCASLEYLISYIMEKTFHARWWDYSDKKYNLNGRICLETSIPFGLFGTLSIYIFNPKLFSFFAIIPTQVLNIVAFILIFIMAIDFSISFHIIFNFKNDTFRLKEDNTDEITAKVKQELINISKSYKRLLKSFPKIKFGKVR